MKLGFIAGFGLARIDLPMPEIMEAENLGLDSVWTAEAYGADAVSTAAWILSRTKRIRVGTGIMQMSARTPTCAAMTAMTLAQLSGNRFLLGIGPSGPGVIEGWHGSAYGRPLTRTREYVAIIRKILAREEPLTHDGFHYQIPYQGKDATGLGIPLKSILHGDPDLPIYTAAITPNGLRTSGECADGVFPIWMDPEQPELITGYLEEGFAKAGGGKSLADFDVAPFVMVVPGDDLEACRLPVKKHLALYIGGMGPRDRNFYNQYTCRMGFEAEAKEIQNLYLDGEKEAAAAAVPDALVDGVALVGPPDRIRERLQAWKAAGRDGQVGSLLMGGASVEGIRLVAEEIL